MYVGLLTQEEPAPHAPVPPPVLPPRHPVPAKREFVDTLAGETGLSHRVVEAWVNHEQGHGSRTTGGGNDWLNVETGRGGSGPQGATARYVEALSPAEAARYTADWLRKNQPSIPRASSRSSAAQVQAIIRSGFAQSHYGYESASTFLSAA